MFEKRRHKTLQLANAEMEAAERKACVECSCGGARLLRGDFVLPQFDDLFRFASS